MARTMAGGCQCGAIRYEGRIDDDEAYLCHCRMCQRSTGSVSIAFKNLRKDAVRWTTRAPDYFTSSPIARRGFCAACGASLTFEYPDSENMDLTVASFDEAGYFRPAFHFGIETMHRQWLDTSALPEHRITDNARTVDRWMNTIGRLPD